MRVLRSKKFYAALIGLLVAILGSNDLVIPADALEAVLAPIIAYIVGQGVADAGKEKALVEKES